MLWTLIMKLIHLERITTIIIVTSMLILGCSKPYSKPEIVPDSKFKGLSDYSASRLFMVHGMCHHTKEWFVGNVASFKEKYKLHGGGIGSIPLDKGYGVELYTAELHNNKTSVRLYGLIFSGITKEIKQKALCANVSKKNDICEDVGGLYNKKQASINKLIKNELMNNCLADAVIYLGETGRKIRAGVRHAIITSLKHSSNFSKYVDTPVFYYSESLGSKILGDSIVCAENKEKIFFDKEMGATTHFVMAANQIPLLNLGNNKVPCGNSYKAKSQPPAKLITYLDLFKRIDRSKKYNKDKRRSISFSTPLTVLSFTDPNDTLSYEMSKANFESVNLINITVSNASTLFGMIENPLDAHTAYDRNGSFIEYLWTGRDLSN